MDGVQHWLNLGIGHKTAGRTGAAAQAFEQALALDARFAPAYFHLAELAENLGQGDAAVSLYRQAIGLDPRNVQYHVGLGSLLFAHGNWAGAGQCFLAALPLVPDRAEPRLLIEVLNQLGLTLLHQERLDEAAQAFLRILERAPDFAEIHNNLSFVFERQGKLDLALAAACRAVELKPDSPEGHNNLGVALRALHRVADAREAFRRAAELRPDFALAQFNHGTTCLLAGDYCSGWGGYEWRNRTLPQPPRQFAAPRWDGRPIANRTLLVHAEQGYGDSIQFARFLAQAKVMSGARIIVEGPSALLPLLQTVAGVDECVDAGHPLRPWSRGLKPTLRRVDECLAAGNPLPEYDFEIPLPSLPGILQTELTNLPVTVPYLTVDAARRAAWREKLAQFVAQASSLCADDTGWKPVPRPDSAPKLRIGIVWQGNPAQAQNVVRSCPLSQFARLATIPGIVWFSLQKGDASEEEARLFGKAGLLSAPLIPLGPHLHDFADTAAAICELDLVISVDTSVAHLAGALGRPVWTLLCHTPDWRWHLDRPDSPWYPTMWLFRQPAWGDWPAVFDDVARELSLITES